MELACPHGASPQAGRCAIPEHPFVAWCSLYRIPLLLFTPSHFILSVRFDIFRRNLLWFCSALPNTPTISLHRWSARDQLFPESSYCADWDCTYTIELFFRPRRSKLKPNSPRFLPEVEKERGKKNYPKEKPKKTQDQVNEHLVKRHGYCPSPVQGDVPFLEEGIPRHLARPLNHHAPSSLPMRWCDLQAPIAWPALPGYG
jgi:hypothetical protein